MEPEKQSERQLEIKARRRIKRFIETEKPVARVHFDGNNIYRYLVKHYENEIQFRRSKNGKLYKQKW